MNRNEESLQWHDGKSTHSIPLRWLRFECPCVECRVEQTSERRWLPSGRDEFIATKIENTDAGLTIDWKSGHRTVFGAQRLRSSISVADRARSQPVLWGGGGEPQRFDHDQVTSDKQAMLSFMKCFRDEGTAILTGTPSIPGQLESTMSVLGLPLRETFSERIHDVWVDPAGYNIAHTNEGLPPHSDYPSYSHPPSGQVLHMIVNECSGGDSFVVDGWNAARQIQTSAPDLFSALAEVPVPFRQYSAERESFARETIVRLNTMGEVTGFRYSNQLMQPLHPGNERFSDWMDAYVALTETLTDPQNHRQFRLDSGDALFVHGHRVLHGRTQFVVDGKRHLQDCYFEFDDILARVDRLTGLADAKTLGGADS